MSKVRLAEYRSLCRTVSVLIAHYADVELASAPPGVEDHTSSRSEDDSSLKLPGEARVIWNAREFETLRPERRDQHGAHSNTPDAETERHNVQLRPDLCPVRHTRRSSRCAPLTITHPKTPLRLNVLSQPKPHNNERTNSHAE
eukprot:602029-Prorocentrum_minimum.AAC.2